MISLWMELIDKKKSYWLTNEMKIIGLKYKKIFKN